MKDRGRDREKSEEEQIYVHTVVTAAAGWAICD